MACFSVTRAWQIEIHRTEPTRNRTDKNWIIVDAKNVEIEAEMEDNTDMEPLASWHCHESSSDVPPRPANTRLSVTKLLDKHSRMVKQCQGSSLNKSQTATLAQPFHQQSYQEPRTLINLYNAAHVMAAPYLTYHGKRVSHPLTDISLTVSQNQQQTRS